MVVIRLARVGKKKQAFYRIVVADSQRFVKSKFISILGWYNPRTKEINLKKEEILDWMNKGAQPSNTVAVLLKNNGVKLPDWVKITEKVSKPKKEVPEAKEAEVKAPVAEEVKEEVAETVEEAAAEEATESPVAEETAVENSEEEALDEIEEKAAEEAAEEKAEK